MSIHATGERQGPYTLVARVGAGGMGEVWKATDTRLDRTVAVKFSTVEMSARFEREARAIAALNHPHICQIYDIGAGYLVIEFVDGQPLKGPVPIETAVLYATQILDALQAAHAQGIVHRDLKPANILVTKKGIKLLDFGLAKQVRVPSDDGVTQAVTGRHEVLGTPQYMSPEQLQGQPVDHRSDLFSFGCVFYELLTGKHAFASATPAGVMAAILEREPALAGAPPALARIIAACLAKDPGERFQSAIDVRRTLRWAGDVPIAGKRRGGAVAGLAAMVVALAGAVAYLLARPDPPRAEPFFVTRLTYDEGLTTDPAITLDGKLMAFASDRAADNLDIYVQQVAGGPAVRITNEPGDDHEPTFSPDGATVVFRSERDGGGLYLAPALGGPARLLVRGGHDPRVSPDGRLVAYAIAKNGIDTAPVTGQSYVVPLAGGEPRLISTGLRGAASPIWISDRTLLLLGLAGPPPARWWTVDVDRPQPREATNDLPVRVRSASWNPASKQLLFVFTTPANDSGSLWALPLDPQTGRSRAPAHRMTLGIGSDMRVATAADGSVVIANATVTSSVWSIPLPGGAPERITFDAAPKASPAISPDDRYLVYVSPVGITPDIFVRDLIAGTVTAIAPSPGFELYPTFNKENVLFGRYGSSTTVGGTGAQPFGDVFTIPLRGGPPRLIAQKVGRLDQLTDDDRYLVWHGAGRPAAVVRDLRTGAEVGVLQSEGRSIFQPRVTRDGQWIVFIAKATDADSRVYAAPFRGAESIPEAAWIPLTDGMGDDKPRLTDDRTRLYFTSERDGFRCIWMQAIDPATLRPHGDPAPFFHSHGSRRSLRGLNLNSQEISLGGSRLIFNTADTVGNLWKLQPQPRN